MDLAPIVYFAYNRALHARTSLEAIKNNYLADSSSLYIYADGPKEDASEEELNKIKETRKVFREQKWCKEVFINELGINKGCTNSITDGITEMFTKFEKLIIIEDDVQTSKGFLKFMNEALNLYEKDERVMHISGFFPSSKVKLPDTFFTVQAQIWGWATWKRAWKLNNTNTQDLIEKLYNSDRIDEFNLGGHFYGFESIRTGTQVYWDPKWYASVFLANGLALTPKMSLVRNIGHDGSGINCGESNNFNISAIAEEIKVYPVKIIENKKATEQLQNLWKKEYESKKDYKESVKEYIPNKLIHQWKSLSSKRYRELKRIEKLPQFIDCRKFTFDVFDKPIKIFSNKEFLSSYDEIFVQEIFKLKTNNPQPLIVDIGTNIGLIAIYLNNLYPESRIILYEPDKFKFEILQYNLKSFSFPNVTSYNADLDDFIKNNIMKEFNGKHFDFLKIDIPGKELNILNEIQPLLSNVDNLFIRYSSYQKQKQNLNQIIEILSDNGFRYYLNINAYRSPQPFNNINVGRGIDNQVNIFAYRS
jgi:precorrin-6B methylase 2